MFNVEGLPPKVQVIFQKLEKFQHYFKALKIVFLKNNDSPTRGSHNWSLL